MSTGRHNENWQEVLDQTPVEIPLRLLRAQNHTNRIRDIIRQELSRQAQNEGFETWDEANDFSIEDDDWENDGSPYEEEFDPITGESKWDMSPEATEPDSTPNQPQAPAPTPPRGGLVDGENQQEMEV